MGKTGPGRHPRPPRKRMEGARRAAPRRRALLEAGALGSAPAVVVTLLDPVPAVVVAGLQVAAVVVAGLQVAAVVVAGPVVVTAGVDRAGHLPAVVAGVVTLRVVGSVPGERGHWNQPDHRGHRKRQHCSTRL